MGMQESLSGCTDELNSPFHVLSGSQDGGGVQSNRIKVKPPGTTRPSRFLMEGAWLQIPLLKPHGYDSLRGGRKRKRVTHTEIAFRDD